MKLGPTLQRGPALHHSIDLWIQTYMEPVTLKYGKLGTKYLWIYVAYICYSGALQRTACHSERETLLACSDVIKPTKHVRHLGILVV